MMIQRALKWAPEDDHERREEPQPGAQPVATEEHQAKEPALEEEREHTLGGQQAAEDVADEPGVVDQFIPNSNSWTIPVAMPMANTSP